MKLNTKFDLNVNPAKDIDLGVNPDEESIWSVRMARTVQWSYRRETRVIQETLVKDQRDNYMLVYSAVLRDQEKYDYHDWIKPSFFDVCGGWTDNLFTKFRNDAMKAFETSEKAIP